MPNPLCSLPTIVIAVAANAVGQVGWTQLNPATRPPARSGHATTYDSSRGVTVLFGGLQFTALDDTWEWNGVNWSQRVTATTPPARQGHALAFDMARARVVLFGGEAQAGHVDDTWEFDGNTWTQIPTANQPSPRRFARMEYDAARGKIVLFGGGRGTTSLPNIFNDTWEWNGVSWTARSPATLPTPRWAHGMAYDFARARIVMCAGDYYQWRMNDTWTWDGIDWTEVLGIPPPPTGAAFGLAKDTTGDVVVRFGGLALLPETWLFDNVAWRRDPRATPPDRIYCSLTHDLLRGQTVLFGGRIGVPLDDTWEYDPGTIARWMPLGSGCAGTSGVPMLRPVGASLPIVGTTFQLELLGIPGNAAAISYGFSNQTWNGNTLPFSLGALGMTGCTLHASPDIMFFAPAVAGRATTSWSVPNNPSLIGVGFYNQGFVLDPGINPVGATVSNAGAGTIGPF